MSKQLLELSTGVWLLYCCAPDICRLCPSSAPSRPPMAKGSDCHTRAQASAGQSTAADPVSEPFAAPCSMHSLPALQPALEQVRE